MHHKVTADGRLAVCDAFHSPVGKLGDLLEDGGKHREIFSDIAERNPFDDPQCGICNVGICGGELFCKPILMPSITTRATSCRLTWSGRVAYQCALRARAS